MFGNPIVRDRLKEAETAGEGEHQKSGQNGDGSDDEYENSDSTMSAEPEYKQKVVKSKFNSKPEEYDDKGLPPQVVEVKKQIRQERKEEEENGWTAPEEDQDKIEKKDVVEKSEQREAG